MCYNRAKKRRETVIVKKLTKDQTIYLLGGVIVVLVIAIIATVVLLQPQNSFKLKNDSETNQSETNNNKDLPASSGNQETIKDDNQSESTPEPNTPGSTPEPSPDSNQEAVDTPSSPQTPTPTPSAPSTNNQTPTTPAYSENDVINYFQTASNNLDQQNDQNNSSFVDKAKNAFTTVVDFIFYGKEINGYTFSELTTSAKMKIIEIALKIDSKINEYFPDYKESIKAGYENIKGKLAYAYLEITSSLCEAVGTDTCNQAKEDFNNMKKSFGFTFDLIKELAKSGASKVKEFYENTFKN